VQAKRKDIIGTWLLVTCFSVSFLAALGLAIYPDFPLRTYMIEQDVLGAVIGFFGVLSAGFLAAILLRYINKQTQTYIWRREQILKDIETIYEPLYQDVSIVARVTDSLGFLGYTKLGVSWKGIGDSHLGTKLRLLEPRLYKDLQYLFDNYREYETKLSAAIEEVTHIARQLIEKRLDESIAQGNLALKELVPRPPSKPTEPQRTYKDDILDEMPKRLNYGEYIYCGFLKGKNVREWSKLQTDNEERYIHWAWGAIKDKSYVKCRPFSLEEIDVLLDEIYHGVQADTAIMEKARWCESFAETAKKLQKELEDHIIEPQLP
jgi:hypothetical protein